MLQQHTFTESFVDGLSPTTGSPQSVFRLVQIDVDSFESHAASLPTLDDLMAEFRAEDPAFDDHYTTADEKLYQEALAAVRAGEFSRITAERLRIGITQAELANRADMLQPNISRLEKPGASMNVATAKKIAESLGLDDYKVLLP